MRKKVIYVDIDETICETPDKPRVYRNAKPILENIEKINKLYDEGHTIVYWTARGSRTNINWYDLTKLQLDEWGAKHHELRVDKPYYDLFIDDKNMRIEEI
jgi:hydroxymethylpyrimidine pyrophosphatase-like HAD family hydrolase